jgi:hypothetical protein
MFIKRFFSSSPYVGGIILNSISFVVIWVEQSYYFLFNLQYLL